VKTTSPTEHFKSSLTSPCPVTTVPGTEAISPQFKGYIMLSTTLILFSVSMYCMVISKLFPPTGFALLDAVADDEYYCVLIPLTLPVTILAAYWNWASMKTFRHN